jgi:hypothetical protein
VKELRRRKLKIYYVAKIRPCYVCRVHGDRPGWVAVTDIDFMHPDALYPIYVEQAYNKREAIKKARARRGDSYG